MTRKMSKAASKAMGAMTGFISLVKESERFPRMNKEDFAADKRMAAGFKAEEAAIQRAEGKAQALKDIAAGEFENNNPFAECADYPAGYAEAFEEAMIAERGE